MPIDKISPDELETHILSLVQKRSSRSVCCYAQVWGEVSTEKLLHSLVSSGIELCTPRIDGAVLVLHRTSDPSLLLKGTYNIPEPSRNWEVIDKHSVDMFVVPGTAFDMYGNRKGRGKGYYDRLLEGVGGYKVGVCYTRQFVSRLTPKPHDIPMDMVVVVDDDAK